MIGYLGFILCEYKVINSLGAYTHETQIYQCVSITVISRNQVYVGLRPAHASFKS